ncbi:MAG: LLM class flavin-dependent oxidoreductase [Micromonosporaceae bacterium]|jgi:phthiodiolone/phenolphthiodiolone dimycocerosates ketoreductase
MIAVGTNATIAPPVESVIRGAQRAESRGYDSLWWPDHLMGFHPQLLWRPEVTALARAVPNPHIFVDPVAAIAACAVHTERIRLGTSVTDAIRRHPAMLAQEFLTLDHFSKGRTILGIGAGEGENITPYGMSFDRPVARLEESLRIIRLLWSTDEPVDFDGEWWTLRDAVLGLQPYRTAPDGSPLPPPIWCGAHGPRMLDLTGRLCDGWLPIYQGGPQRWRSGLERIRAAAAAAGRDLTGFTPGLLAHVVVAETESELDRLLDSPLIRAWMLTLPSSCFEEFGVPHPLGKGAYGLLDYIPTRMSADEVEAALAAVPDGLARRYLLAGSPDDILAELREFVSAGLEHLVLWNLTYLADASLLRSSYAVLDEIAQRLRQGGT